MQAIRLRRLRKNSNIRDWISQTELRPKNIILPYFVVEARGIREPIRSMPGVYHLSIDNLIKDIEQARKTGIQAILLFGIPKFKDDLDSLAYKKNGVVQKAIRAIKIKFREIKQDIDEGADIIMIKPALAYLDIIWRAKQKFNVPLAAYNVSGEYSMIKKLSNGDKIKERELALEVLTSIKRAGADLIITYHAKEITRWLKKGI